jgi:hypothetical protein
MFKFKVFLSQLLLLSLPSLSVSTVQSLVNGPYGKRDADADEPGLRGTLDERNRAHMAHAVVISLAVVVLLPMGAIILRVVPSRMAVQLHWIFQLFSMAVLLTGFGLGVWLSWLHNEVR